MLDFGEVLTSAKAGDESSFVVLFRSVQPVLLRYLTTLGGQFTEDAAAETWVSVVRGLGRFRSEEAGGGAWVFSCTHNGWGELASDDGGLPGSRVVR